MEFPSSKLIKSSLLRNHPDYNAELVSRLKAYYEGGPDFPIKDELRKKPIELAGNEIGAAMREVRIGAAFYTNYFADTIDDLVATICENCIEISDNKNRPYWANLANNINGLNGSATSEARATITDDILLGRGFFLIKFPTPKAPQNSKLSAQLAAGDLDAQIVWLDASMVTSWKLNADGLLEWARTYEKELTGDDYDEELHTWTFYTVSETAVYTFTKPIDKDFDDTSAAELKSLIPHNLGLCPVFKVDNKTNSRIGEKLLPTARQLFNEEADSSFFMFTSKTNSTVIFTDDANRYKNGITFSTFGALLLGKDDRLESPTVDSSAATAFENAAAARRSQLGGLIHNMARQSAQQSASGQNTSRNTGKALEKHKDPLSAWLRGKAEYYMSCIKLMLQAIADMQEEDISELKITGLVPEENDEDDVFDMDTATKFLALPRVSNEYKNAYAMQVGHEACESVGVDEIELEELRNSKPVEPEEINTQEPTKPEVMPTNSEQK